MPVRHDLTGLACVQLAGFVHGVVCVAGYEAARPLVDHRASTTAWGLLICTAFLSAAESLLCRFYLPYVE